MHKKANVLLRTSDPHLPFQAKVRKATSTVCVTGDGVAVTAKANMRQMSKLEASTTLVFGSLANSTP